MHSPSSDFITTRLGAPRWVPDWRTMLAQAEEADSPHPALMRQLEGAIADLKPRDIDTPETLSRLTDVRGLSVTAKERLVRLCARVGAEHAGEKTWDAAVRTGMDTRIGRAMLQKKDPGLVGAYANLVSRTAIRSPLNPVKAASNLPLAKEAEGIISAELGKRSTQKAVERVLQTAWNAEKSTSVKLASQARRSLERGDSMLAFFRNLGPVGKLINVAVLTGMLSGMLPATASAGYRKQGTAVAERAAGDPGQATKARPNPVAPAPGDAVSPRAPEAPLRVESTKSQPAPPSTGKLPDLKTERSFTDGQNAITIRADSGVNVPSDPGAEKNGKVRMPAVTPTASVSVTNGDMQANLEFMGRV